MSNVATQAPPDQRAREVAVDPNHSILVQAPAGSGKTNLLTRRFLRLLSEVDDPAQVVAITFTKAAAAEMRERILSKLEKAEASDRPTLGDPFSMEALARRALERSHARGWQLLDLSSRLRISTIDSFCRELALQQPLLAGFGGTLDINEQPTELYRRAARLTLERLGDSRDPALAESIEALLLWRDNNWHEMENQLVDMLGQRDRWMQDFVLDRETDWESLRARLERPFANAVADGLARLTGHLRQVPGAMDEALELARFAHCHGGAEDLTNLTELAELPCGPFREGDDLEAARQTYVCLAKFLLKDDGTFRRQVNRSNGFPPGRDSERERMLALVSELTRIPELADALHHVHRLPHALYTDEEWRIVRACFTVLRRASGELKAVFAEVGAVDFVEVAQIAQQVLRGQDDLPGDAALAVADGIRHLLVDEFQDTSRRQHQLLSSLVAAWPDQHGRSIFVVGDAMQSIYFFRDADVELFQRIGTVGLEASDGSSLPFIAANLTANFRTAPELVRELNSFFARISANDDGSGISLTPAEPARPASLDSGPRLRVHLAFQPQSARASSAFRGLQDRNESAAQIDAARATQTAGILDLIRSHSTHTKQARESGEKYRIAILGRAHTVLAPVAVALREAQIPFRAVDLENLKDRPEILDALALARALINQQDRVGWLGVLRAPWCGLGLEELHRIAGTDQWSSSLAPVPQLLRERKHLLSEESRAAIERVLLAVDSLPRLHASVPTGTLGTLLQQIWLSLGGDRCTDATARANLSLFWTLLDSLPQGEQDLCGPALDTALEKLFAVPDPAASSDVGVQLMTIHGSKGLEFEVVIVPDLQATTPRGSKKLLSWLERGLTDPDESSDVTEFLVAPVQPKGDKRGKAKEWVDRVYAEREAQEDRRILYVAATRAREELHFFARPAYKRERDNSLALVKPVNSLLATAWPALEEVVKAQFEKWKQGSHSPQDQQQVIPAIAASGESNLLVMPRPPMPAILRRLPAGFQASPIASAVSSGGTSAGNLSRPYRRHEGGLVSRALGSAVHSLLEELALLRTTVHDWNAAILALDAKRPAITARIRAVGVPAPEAMSITSQAIQQVHKAAIDPVGRWILSPHAESASEAGWAGVVAGDLRQVRVDRVFRAGLAPLLEGNDAWWVIDFKTARADDAGVLPAFRAAFAPQLEMYSTILRKLHGTDVTLRAGLYYPGMSLLDWWAV